MINFGAFAKNDRLLNSIHCARARAIKKAFILYVIDNGHDGNKQREMSLFFGFVVFFLGSSQTRSELIKLNRMRPK